MSNNLRWYALELRAGDIIISAPPKCGVTWTQRLVSLLVFDGPELPAPMSVVSPWLDQTVRPVEEVVAGLDAQRHRRFIKTHTPLDGLALDDRVTYLCVGRDPRDAAVSQLFHAGNVDEHRLRMLHTAFPEPPMSAQVQSAPPPRREVSPADELRQWMESPIIHPKGGPNHATGVGSLIHVLHHFGEFWRRRHLPNVAALHYSDLQADLAGELVRLAGVLGYDVDRDRAEELARHAQLDVMRSRAAELAPNATEGLWHSNERFFRTGGRGEWREMLGEADQRRYRDRVAELVPPDLAAWAHDGRHGCDPDLPVGYTSSAR